MNDKRMLIINPNDIIYTVDEICPCCGTYTTDGSVCNKCLNDNGLYKPKTTHYEE